MSIGAMATAIAGLTAGVDRFERAATRTARPDGADDVGAVVDRVVASHAVAAEVAVVRSSDEMIGTLLDIVA